MKNDACGWLPLIPWTARGCRSILVENLLPQKRLPLRRCSGDLRICILLKAPKTTYATAAEDQHQFHDTCCLRYIRAPHLLRLPVS